MTVVVDLGCANYGSQDSLRSLVDRYQPTRVYGFDPYPLLDDSLSRYNGSVIELRRKAAWLYDGEVRFHQNLTRSFVSEDDGSNDFVDVPCFDFSSWLRDLGEHVILKMDVEGAEYELLERMIADGTDHLVDELIIEWHDDDDHGLTERLACPVQKWWI